MQTDITPEIRYKTSRSGGKGGQNVNKVETMVEARWSPALSELLTEKQKWLVQKNLIKKLTLGGELIVKSQEARTQLENKNIATNKLHKLLKDALFEPKNRLNTKPTKSSKLKRLDRKKKHGDIKSLRNKSWKADF